MAAATSASIKMRHMPLHWKLFLIVVLFIALIAPTFVSYEPYIYRWDDSDYLIRSMTVSKAVWSGDRHGLTAELHSDIRPPVMSMLALPWRPSNSWDQAGKCFVSLATLIAFFAAVSLFLLLRIGLDPLYLILASICAFASLGPFPAGSGAHFFAAGFLADSLFSWICLAAILLIPYESATPQSSDSSDYLRGALWAVIFSAGALTKANFFYFLGLIVPVLLMLRLRQRGLRSALTTLAAFAVCSLPVALYWVRFGIPALRNGWAASFGHDANFYRVPLFQFLGNEFRQSPGLLLTTLFVCAGIVYLTLKRRTVLWSSNILPFLIMAGYITISLTSSNRQLRYIFPGIIALPFLIGILISRQTIAFSQRAAMLAALGCFCGLAVAGAPTLHRPDKQSISKSEEVLTAAIDAKATRVLLATNSPTLNRFLMKIAFDVSSPQPSVELDSLTWRAATGEPIEKELNVIRESDLVVFQNNEALDPPFSNERKSDYEKYTQQLAGNIPAKIVDGISFYEIPHSSH